MSRLFVAVSAAVASLVLAAPAFAADIPTKAAAVKGPVAAYNWSGCYLGGNAGWIGGPDRFTNYPGPSVVSTLGLTSAQIAAAISTYTADGSSFTGGVQIGCNWQGAGSRLVLGVEADFDWSGLKESATAAIPFTAPFLPHTETVTRNLDWYSTFRGRLGYAADRWLAFVTGGVAFAHIKASQTFVFTASGNNYTGTDSRTRTGWTLGGGLEYAFTNNWSAKVEYLYLDFGTFTFNSPLSTAPSLAWATDVRTREHVVRTGLNYRF